MATPSVPREEVIFCSKCFVPWHLHRCGNRLAKRATFVEKQGPPDLPGLDNVSSFTDLRLSRPFEMEYPCPHEKSGCKEIIAAPDLEKHLARCLYGKITRTASNNGTLAKNLNERYSSSRRCLSLLKDGKISADGPWELEVLQKDGHIFQLHSEIRDEKTVYFWMTVLGSQKTAEKYKFELKLLKNKMETSWNMPVVAFDSQAVSIGGSSCYVTIPATILEKYCTPMGPLKLWFDMSFRILQAGISGGSKQ